jgi:exo-beta-1,3-glucanase (GH17 family)
MTTTQFIRAVRRISPAAWLGGLLIGMAGLLSACGDGGTVPAAQPGGLRALPAEYSTRKAVNYSPYRTENRDTEVVTRENIQEDLGLLAQSGFTLLRTFDSSDKVTRLMLEIIRDNQINIKVQLGIYLAYTAFGTEQEVAEARRLNDAEINRGVKLASEFNGIVIAVSVGNESVGFGRTTPDVMAGYLAQVRANVTQPVTMNDVWDAFAPGPGGGTGMPPNVINLLDFVSMHSYPILTTSQWDWEQQAVPESGRAAAMMDAAVQRVIDSYAAVRKHLVGQGQPKLPIVVGETGWKAVATSTALTYLAHPANQKMYYDRLVAWSDKSRAGADGAVAIFYFEAFDEPWKAVVNPDFDDDKWGLFNVQRQARFVIQNLFPRSQWAPGDFTLADAVFAPTVVSVEITADRYTVYADLPTVGEAIAPVQRWDGFDSPPNAFAGEGVDAALAFEGEKFMEIGPAPAVYGWGALTSNAEPVVDGDRVDLNQFQATGRLNFSIKTSYPGKLMFGFGTAAAGAVFVVASNTNADGYGYVNDGQWHKVSIPISAFTAAGGAFDLSKVTNTFVIADIYDRTGNTVRGNETKVFIDAVFWSR